MKIAEKKLQLIEEIICYCFILLFVYAAISKILDFENFRAELGQSPLLSAFAFLVAPGILVIELVIAVLLSFKSTRIWAMLSAFSLMIMFTTYILIILNFSDFVPCSCGGVLQRLGWREHIIFNIVFVLLASIGFYIMNHKKPTNSMWKISIILLGTTLVSITLVYCLYLFSESRIQNENPFIRRIIPLSATKTLDYELDGYGYYFAGSYNDKIYLGNHNTPLYITEIDTVLNKTVNHKIQLDRYDFPFRSAEVRIVYPYFFVFDGMVPVVYRGRVSDFMASVIMDKKIFFTEAAILNSEAIAIRGEKRPTGENILGVLKIGDEPHAKFTESLLEKQLDGIFDTDGEMVYNERLAKLVYTYFYRNQFIVMDSNLQLNYRGRTIDTITTAKLDIVTIKDSGDTKLASPPLMVNRHIATEGNILFVNSMLRGQYESGKVWKTASAIDMYDLNNSKYLSSFYIYNSGNERLKEFMVTPTALYAILGKTIHKYEFGPKIQQRLK